MIALTDIQIDKWSNKLNNYLHPILIMPKYVNDSSYPSISISYLLKHISYSDITINHLINYEETFSISKERNEKFLKTLKELRNDSIGNKIIYDPAFNESFRLNEICGELKENIIEHKLNNKDYILYSFSVENFPIHEVIIQFWLIETSLNIAVKDNLYNIGDVVSRKDDKSEDYVILSSILASDDFFVVRVKDNDDEVITYDTKIRMRATDMSLSRTDRINSIIGK